LWSYVYNIVRIFSSKVNEKANADEFTSNMKSCEDTSKLLDGNCSEAVLPSENHSVSVDNANKLMLPSEEEMKVAPSSSLARNEIYYDFEV
jgi:hypothetical protein